TVYVPLLFGRPGEFRTAANFLRACGSGDFDCHNAKSHGRIAAEMKALLTAIDAEAEGDGVNAIGMCLTGALPLELIAIGAPVRAAVVAQPAIPFFRPTVIPLSDSALADVGRKNIPIIATRFSEDRKSPRCRLELLEKALGDQVTTIEIDSKPGNPYGFTKESHAVLTSWYSDAQGHPTRNVLEQAIAIFRKD
ncbi:MAG: dienelactone hydrolase family protein, partial [Acidobacteriota bacterium]|nr:dienelactone hydrolase family protein [Acidobacteriota bacterium]